MTCEPLDVVAVPFKLFTLDVALLMRKLGAPSERDGQVVAGALSRSLAV